MRYTLNLSDTLIKGFVGISLRQFLSYSDFQFWNLYKEARNKLYIQIAIQNQYILSKFTCKTYHFVL